MSELNKSRLKALLISLFFALPFIFIFANLAFLGNSFLINTSIVLIVAVFMIVYNCIMCDVKGELEKEVDWKKRKLVNNITYLCIFTGYAIILYIF